MKLIVLFGVFACAQLFAQDAVPLISPNDPSAGWKFNNGREFPGATGSLTVDSE